MTPPSKYDDRLTQTEEIFSRNRNNRIACRQLLHLFKQGSYQSGAAGS